MNIQKITGIAFAAVLASTAVDAQQFYGMENDPGVMDALNNMGMAFGQACQMGDPQGCNSYQYVQQLGNYMYGASSACMQGDQMGCQAYMQVYQQLDSDYGMFVQQYSGGQQFAGGFNGAANASAATHEQRMQQIQAMGAQSTANWQANNAQMDANHAAFMSTINN